MDVDSHQSLQNGKVGNGDSYHYDKINEVSDTFQTTTKNPLSKLAESEHLIGKYVDNSRTDTHRDGGYGWVIVTASFFVAFIVDGIGSSFGLLLPYILSKFQASTFVTSFAGSLIMAFVIMGSISTFLVKKFGFRAVTVAGSVLSCVAFVISTFSPNIYIFIVTYGLITGCSCGLVFIPSIIIVNEYFHEKRGVANGIICSGSGVGLLVLAPLTNFLLDTYSLSGTILVLAGILLNMCVFSSLFRPLALSPAVCVSDNYDRDRYNINPAESLSSSLSVDNLDHCTFNEICESEIRIDQDRKEMQTEVDFAINEILDKCQQIYLKNSSGDLKIESDQKEKVKKSTYYVEYMLSHLKPDVSVLPEHTTSQFTHHQGHHKSLDKHLHDDNKAWRSSLHLDLANFQPITKHHQTYSMHDIAAWSKVKSHRHKTIHKNLKRFDFRGHQKLHLPGHSHHHHSQNLSIDHASSLYLAGSIHTLMNLHSQFLQTLHSSEPRALQDTNNSCKKLHEYIEKSEDCNFDSEQLVKHNISQLDDGDNPIVYIGNQHFQFIDVTAADSDISSPADESTELSTESGPLGYTLSQLLCMPSFHFFCLGAALIQIGYPLAGTFLADYAYQFRLTKSHTAILMSLLGGLNICGRLLSGTMANFRVDPLLLNNVSLLLGGAACLMSPLYTQFWSLCVFAGMFGFFLGFFPPLQPLIIVKHFGLDSLASAFGFLSTIKGIASIVGAPLAGCIYDITGQYSLSFIFGGIVFVLSSFVHFLMAFCSGKCKNTKLCPLQGCKKVM